VDGADLEETKVRSAWIVGQVDIRGWAHALPRQSGTSFSVTQAGPHIALLMSPPETATKAMEDAYIEWFEEAILAPLREKIPELYRWLVEYQKRLVSEMSKVDLAVEISD